MFKFVIFCSLVTICFAIHLNEEFVQEQWQLFKNNFNRDYDTEFEHNLRYKIFMENLKYIEEHNEKYNQGLITFELGVNHFADKLHSEYIEEMLTLDVSHRINKDFSFINDTHDLNYKLVPYSKDWSQEGGVTYVKNQGSCGSCYAFASVGTIETHSWKSTRRLVPLSEQNIIDCAENQGCDGGHIITAFEYARDKGIDTESSYHYHIDPDNVKHCRYQISTVGARIRGFATVHKNETTMKSIVGLEGPVATQIDARLPTFKFYKRGIYHDAECKKRPNHAMVIVGYGNVRTTEFWKVKNSWGSRWGEKGYIRMIRNRNNICGIASNSFYPKM